MSYRWLATMALLTMFGWCGDGIEAVEPPGEQPWIAFFKPPHGAGEPLRTPLEQYAETDWLHLGFSQYSGPRIRLAVVAEGRLPNLLEGSVSPGGIAARLADALEQTHRFDVVTRGRQETTEATATGRWPASVQYLIRVTPAADDGDALRMTFRIIDAVGGQVIFANTESTGMRSRGAASSRLEALDICINKATYRLALWLAQRPWAGSVIKVDHGKVVIDAGSQNGLVPKMQLRALIHQEVVDPESGQLLGATTRGSGILELVEVQEQRAVARVLEGCEELAKGDRVELMQP